MPPRNNTAVFHTTKCLHWPSSRGVSQPLPFNVQYPFRRSPHRGTYSHEHVPIRKHDELGCRSLVGQVRFPFARDFALKFSVLSQSPIRMTDSGSTSHEMERFHHHWAVCCHLYLWSTSEKLPQEFAIRSKRSMSSYNSASLLRVLTILMLSHRFQPRH